MKFIVITFFIILTYSCASHQNEVEMFGGSEADSCWVASTKSTIRRPLGKDSQVLVSEHPALIRADENNKDFTGDFDCSDNDSIIFDYYGWDYEPYLKALQKKIKSNVCPPREFSRVGAIEGKCLVQFKILPEGKLEELELLYYRGHRTLAETSILAVEFSAPFEPLPEDFLKQKKYLNVKITFCLSVKRNF